MTKRPRRRDVLTTAERSEHMSRVRNGGNASTELAIANIMAEAGIGGWEARPKDIAGKPDFFFRSLGLAVFVDGCFWHGCPICARRVPHNRSDFWATKLADNVRRDRRVTRILRAEGMSVVRIWEHAVSERKWLAVVRRLITRRTLPERATMPPTGLGKPVSDTRPRL